MKPSKNLLILIATLLATPLAVMATSEDRRIEDAAKASYNYRTVLHDRVKIEVKDGVVTLTGSVEDRDQSRLAEDTVESLPGVVRVDNRITVDAKHSERSDGWIALKIRSQLLMKSNVSATNTDVNVKDGVVTLTGTADNLAQKELTTLYAREIEGVKDVNNDIVVQVPNRAPVHTDQQPASTRNGRSVGADNNRDLGEVIDDASITAQVKYALLAHRSTSALSTDVTTIDGVVNVAGVASSDAEKSLVTQLARNVRGVKSVDNNMTVKKGY